MPKETKDDGLKDDGLPDRALVELSRLPRYILMFGVFPWIVGHFLYACVKELAGKITWADLNGALSLSLSGQLPIVVNVTIGVSVVFGLAGSIWGIAMHYLYRRQIARYAPLVRELEEAKDPDRDSSGLTPSGRTRPQDR
jgi:hypothetical protein